MLKLRALHEITMLVNTMFVLVAHLAQCFWCLCFTLSIEFYLALAFIHSVMYFFREGGEGGGGGSGNERFMYHWVLFSAEL